MKTYRDRLETVDEQGRRIWVYADTVSGLWKKRRTIVASFLVVFYLAVPWIKIGGLPLFQLDFGNGRLILGGVIYWFHEFSAFLLLVFAVLFLMIAVTAKYGRIWCGWMCPQTVFLEFIFRPIERYFEGRGHARKQLDSLKATDPKRVYLKALKYLSFSFVCFIVANTFLSYFIGMDKLLSIITTAPANNMGLFLVMVAVFLGFAFNFGWFREQMCTLACPYGRLQSVLLDPNSMVVGYNFNRGEPRGKDAKGDCIDCKMCVKVCPTGIDIRNGTQLECVNCTACIDACNFVMDKVGTPKDLISYTTENKLLGKSAPKMNFRFAAFIGLSVLFVAGSWFLVSKRSLMEVQGVKSFQTSFSVAGDSVTNHLRFRVKNKGHEPGAVQIESLNESLSLIIPQNGITVQPQQELDMEVFTTVKSQLFEKGKFIGKIRFKMADAQEDKTITLLGPQK